MLRSNSAHYKHCADESAEAPQAERFCSGVQKREVPQNFSRTPEQNRTAI